MQGTHKKLTHPDVNKYTCLFLFHKSKLHWKVEKYSVLLILYLNFVRQQCLKCEIFYWQTNPLFIQPWSCNAYTETKSNDTCLMAVESTMTNSYHTYIGKKVIPHTVVITLNNTGLTDTAVESTRWNSSPAHRTHQFCFLIHISMNYKVQLCSCPHLWDTV